MRFDPATKRWNHHWDDGFVKHACCVTCTLPVDMAESHFKRKNGDVFCIGCAISGGWLADPQNPNVKKVTDNQLANAARKRRFK